MTSRTNQKSLLYIWDRYALFYSHFIDVNPHKHHALQLTFALNDPIILKVDDGEWKEYNIRIGERCVGGYPRH